MRKRPWILAGLAVLLVASFGAAAWKVAWARQNPEAARIARYERIFEQAWSIVDKHYYDPAFDHARWRQIRDVYRPHVREMPSETMLYINVLQNMMSRVGTSHVNIGMPPVERIESREPAAAAGPDGPSKPFGCGGRYLRIDYGFDLATVRRGAQTSLVVADVRRGSPAEQAGLAPGDLLRKMTLAHRSGGCPHATMAVVNPGQAPRALAFEVEDRENPPPRQRIDLPSGVRVLRFDKFDSISLDWLSDNLTEAPRSGLVLDLRRNGGGKIWVERKVAGLFLPEGVVVARNVSRGRERLEKTQRASSRYDGALVVLMGPATGSAGEVTAAALKHERRAILVGSQTAGAVLMSRNFPLPGGGSVQVAIADVLTPDGKRLEGVGVKPDLAVLQTLDAVRAGRDLPLEAAVQALLEGRARP
ncbi:S41 family peptidase [Caulobacter sp. SL161]|uniref:S41 family peptidase n=1 Tax=Caulobacter sp. SL161 TaxID=2995156 RepID=UPI0022726E66|nr:S41 family peptidase [Caulobacter sp. SL161]MCY1647212.1 S41 family peptidase [Caulobacter sp. SL161]